MSEPEHRAGSCIARRPRPPFHGRPPWFLPPFLRPAENAERLEWGKAWTNADHVFTREDGQPWEPDRVSKLLVKAVTKAKVPRIRLHEAKHLAQSDLGAALGQE